MPMSQTAVLEPDVTKRTSVAKRDGTRVHRTRWRTTLAGIVLTGTGGRGSGSCVAER